MRRSLEIVKDHKLSIRRMVAIAFSLSILICAKYKFGINISGIEIVTGLFVLFSIVYSLAELCILVISFNLLVLVIYGFGPWWIAYWYIWPMFVLIFNLGYKIFSKNSITMALFAFMAAFSLIFWYFIDDFIFFGKTFAISHLITAVPVNLIEGLVNGIFVAVAYYPFINLVKHLDIHSNKYFANIKFN